MDFYFSESGKWSLKTLSERWNKEIGQDWKDKVIAEYSQGKSDIEIIAKILCISKGLFYRLLREEPEFKETIQRGRQLSEAWWIAEGKKGIWDTDETKFNEKGKPISRNVKRMNAKVYSFNMINRFRYGESFKDLEEKHKKEEEEEQANEKAKAEGKSWADEIKKKI